MMEGAENALPERRHLERLQRIYVDRPIYFVTICSFGKKPVLTRPKIAKDIAEAFDQSETVHGWAVGRYVIMPTHVHFFCRGIDIRKDLSEFVRDLKRWLTQKAREYGHEGQLWQKEFFDHMLRSDESYEQKSVYVWNNPVRAGLCNRPEEWPDKGECTIMIF